MAKKNTDQPAPPIEVTEDGTVIQGDIKWEK